MKNPVTIDDFKDIETKQTIFSSSSNGYHKRVEMRTSYDIQQEVFNTELCVFQKDDDSDICILITDNVYMAIDKYNEI